MSSFASIRCERSQASMNLTISTTDDKLRKQLRLNEHELVLEGKAMEFHQRQRLQGLNKESNLRFQQNTSVQKFTHTSRFQSPGQTLAADLPGKAKQVTILPPLFANKQPEIKQKNDLKEKEKQMKNKEQETRKRWREKLAQETRFQQNTSVQKFTHTSRFQSPGQTLPADLPGKAKQFTILPSLFVNKQPEIRQKNDLKEKEKQIENKEQETRKLWREKLAQEARYEKERKEHVKKQLLKEQPEVNAVREQQREVQNHKEMVENEQSLRVQSEVDKRMQLTTALTMSRVKRRQIKAEAAANKLAPQKEQAAQMALQKENLAREQVEKQQAEEAQKRRLKEESQRAAMLQSVHKSRQEIIRMKEERKQAEQRKDQEWADFTRNADMMYIRRQKEVAQKIREKNIEVSKTNFAMAEEKRARAELEEKSKREGLLKSRRQPAETPYRYYDAASELLKAARKNIPILDSDVRRQGLVLDGKRSDSFHAKSNDPLLKSGDGHTLFIQYEEHTSLQQAKAGFKGDARKMSAIKDLPGNTKQEVTTLPVLCNKKRQLKPARLPDISKMKYRPVPPYAPRLI